MWLMGSAQGEEDSAEVAARILTGIALSHLLNS